MAQRVREIPFKNDTDKTLNRSVEVWVNFLRETAVSVARHRDGDEVEVEDLHHAWAVCRKHAFDPVCLEPDSMEYFYDGDA